ncbi:hypothetical protein EZS27_025911, partial [termite gut metagenome]
HATIELKVENYLVCPNVFPLLQMRYGLITTRSAFIKKQVISLS